MMDKELRRLASFSNWPNESNLRPPVLARNGFYYSDKEDRLICSSCHVKFDRLLQNGNLMERHKQQSSGCRFAQGHQDGIDTGRTYQTVSDLASITPAAGAEAAVYNDYSLNLDHLKSIYKSAVDRLNSRKPLLTHSAPKLDSTIPDFDQLRCEEMRLSTFRNWPSGANATPQALAREGLFYTGVDDRVQCAFCQGYIRKWQPTDNPSAEHKRLFPECPFVRGHDVGNVPFRQPTLTALGLRGGSSVESEHQMRVERTNYEDRQSSQFPKYSQKRDRVESFKKENVVMTGPSVEALAEAGWFFVGPGDKVLCFECGGNLKDWQPNDDPWEEHSRWYPNCIFVKTHRPTIHKLDSNITSSQTSQTNSVSRRFPVEPREVKARLDTTKVRSVLEMGYSRELVRRAVENQLRTKGDDFPSVESLMEAVFQIQEEDEQRHGLSSGRSASTDPSSPSASSLTSTGSSSCNTQPELTFETSLPCNLSSRFNQGLRSLTALPGEKEAVAGSSALQTPSLPNAKGKRKKAKKKKVPTVSSTATLGEEQEILNLHEADQVFNRKEIPDEESTKFLEENRQLLEARTCKVCMDAEVNTVFLPCGHLVCCNNCSPQLRNCPICRTFVRGTVRTYLS